MNQFIAEIKALICPKDDLELQLEQWITGHEMKAFRYAILPAGESFEMHDLNQEEVFVFIDGTCIMIEQEMCHSNEVLEYAFVKKQNLQEIKNVGNNPAKVMVFSCSE